MRKRILAFLLACVTVCLFFAGCTKENFDVFDSSDVQATDSADPMLTIIADGKSEYVVLRSSTATEAEKQAAMTLRSAIEEKCGVKLKIMNELDITDEKAICVGRINRQTVTELTSTLNYSDYIITLNETDVIICGGTDSKTTEAVEKFISEFLSESTTVLSVPMDLHISVVNKNYKSVKIGGDDLTDYSIVVQEAGLTGLRFEAEDLSAYCLNNFGFGLTVKTDISEATGKEIIIGSSINRTKSEALKAELEACGEDNGLVYFEGEKIWLTGNNVPAVRDAVKEFKTKYLDATKADGDELTVEARNGRVTSAGKEYKIMSFNLLYGDGDGRWEAPEVRKPAVLTQITAENPDILGVQECTEWWYSTLCAEYGDEYAVVGEINSSSQKWRNAIFYRKDMFDLVESGTKWLSKTPDKVSKLSTAGQYRIVTYVVLRDKETGETFAHLNSHLGFNPGERPFEDELIVKIAGELGCPALITADWNDGAFSGLHEFMREKGYWDACHATNINDTRSTVDMCFVSADSINVTSHDLLEELVDGIDPSDHNAAVVTFRLR